MKVPKATKVIAATWLVVLLAMPLVGACARPAPAPTPKPAPAPAPAPKPDPLAQIIEGAKKEGTVSLSVLASYTPAPLVALLRRNIRDKYGVDLDLKVTGSSGYAPLLATAIMEHKTGAVPGYDLMILSDTYVAAGMREGILERVDWRPVADKGTPAEAIPQHPDLRGALAFISTATGLMYNPGKVSATQAPRTLGDLADPKWKGELGVFSYATDWARWAFILGKDSTFSHLRSIMKNKPLVGLGGELNNRYLLGEISVVFVFANYIENNRQKGVPTEFRPIQFLDGRSTYVVVLNKALHPNAAKLVAHYLASPDGVKFSVDNVNQSHLFVPGNFLYDVAMQAKKEGIPVYTIATYPGLLEFSLSEEAVRWEKEAELIIKGAG